MVQLLRIGVLCLNEKGWQCLGVLSTLKSVTNEFHEIHIMSIKILSKKMTYGNECASPCTRIIGPLFYNESLQQTSLKN
jgi:hypothetical protein